MLKVIGAGLSRTGTTTLHLALRALGMHSIHYDQVRLNDVISGANAQPNFRVYDDVDAVVDLPSALFYRELLEAYPQSKVVLTVRDVESWWRSVEVHMNARAAVSKHPSISERMLERVGLLSAARRMHEFRRNVRNCAYGAPFATEFLYKKRFQEHNAQVLTSTPPDRLLVMDIIGGEGWERLCAFLDLPIPDAPFPRSHVTDYASPTTWRSEHNQAVQSASNA